MHDPRLTISLKDAPKPVAPAPVPRAAPSRSVRVRRSERLFAGFARLRRALPATLVVVILIGGAYVLYDWLNPRQDAPHASEMVAPSTASTESAPTEADAEQLVARVARLIELPGGEAPTVAAVTDLAPLSGQPFFERAKIGDIVLLFPQAKRAVLYDSVADRIVEAGPITH